MINSAFDAVTTLLLNVYHEAIFRPRFPYQVNIEQFNSLLLHIKQTHESGRPLSLNNFEYAGPELWATLFNPPPVQIDLTTYDLASLQAEQWQTFYYTLAGSHITEAQFSKENLSQDRIDQLDCFNRSKHKDDFVDNISNNPLPKTST